MIPNYTARGTVYGCYLSLLLRSSVLENHISTRYYYLYSCCFHSNLSSESIQIMFVSYNCTFPSFKFVQIKQCMDVHYCVVRVTKLFHCKFFSLFYIKIIYTLKFQTKLKTVINAKQCKSEKKERLVK